MAEEEVGQQKQQQSINPALNPGLSEIQFEAETRKPEAAPYIPYTPASVLKTLKAVSNAPPLLLSESVGGPKPSIYKPCDVPVIARLLLDGVDSNFKIEIPLAMCHYVSPAGDELFNMELCREAAIANAVRENHNRFVVELLNLFMKANDCGTSGGTMTMPAAPPNYSKIRIDEYKKLVADKMSITRKSINYLAQCGLYCDKDYKFDDAFNTANDVAFRKFLEKDHGRIRVHLPGHRPSWWDGKSSTDENGVPVEWKRGPTFTFFIPDIQPQRTQSSTNIVVKDHDGDTNAHEQDVKQTGNATQNSTDITKN